MEEDSPQATTLRITGRAATIRRIKIRRSYLPFVTHISNNATQDMGFQKNLKIFLDCDCAPQEEKKRDAVARVPFLKEKDLLF